MKKHLLFALILLGMGAQDGWANGCGPNTFLRKIGNVATTTNTVISTAGHDVRLITVTCGGTACVAGLYDTESEATVANLVSEPGAAANGTVILPSTGFFDEALRFQNGIYFVDDINVTAVALYECR